MSNEGTTKIRVSLELARRRERDHETLRLAKEQEAERVRKGKVKVCTIGGATYITTPANAKRLRAEHKAAEEERKARLNRQLKPLESRQKVLSAAVTQRTKIIWERMTQHGETAKEACEALGIDYRSVIGSTLTRLGYTSTRHLNEAARKEYDKRMNQ